MRAMKDDQATTLIWALGAVSAVTVFAVALIMVRNDGGSSLEDELVRQQLGPDFSGEVYGRSFIEEHTSEFRSFEEAEDHAGYHILRPSDEFTLVGGVTYLESWLQPEGESSPASRSVYSSGGGGSLLLQIVPSSYPIGEPPNHSRLTTVGGKEGWQVEDDYRMFGWDCGSTDSGTGLVCMAIAVFDVEDVTFERFVDSLR